MTGLRIGLRSCDSLKCGNCGKPMLAIDDPFKPVNYVCEDCQHIAGYTCDICGYIHDNQDVVIDHVLKAHPDTFVEDLYNALADVLPDIQDEVLSALATILAPGTDARKFVVENHAHEHTPNKDVVYYREEGGET